MDKRNKKAQGTILFSILIAFMLFFVGMIVVNFIKTSVTDARTQNNCSAPTTDGGKLLCLAFDGVVPYFFILVISVSGGLIINRFIQ